MTSEWDPTDLATNIETLKRQIVWLRETFGDEHANEILDQMAQFTAEALQKLNEATA